MDHPSFAKAETNVSIEKLKNGRYRVRWRDKAGVQRAKTFPFVSSAKDFEHRLHAGTLDETEKAKDRPPPFGELAERWLVEYCDVMKSPGERLKDRARLKIYLLPVWGELRLDALTLAHGTSLRAELAKKLKPSTVNNIIKLARKLLADAADWNLIRKSPFDKLKRLVDPERPFAYWMPEERDRFLTYARTADADFYDLVAVAVHTGMRIGELLGLRWDVVDFTRGVIMVRRSQCQMTGALREQTKNGKFRELPMNKVVAEVLRARRGLGKAGDQAVFEIAFPKNAASKLRRMAKNAGVRPIRFHDLRHTFASLMAMAGVDLALLRDLMGHSTYAQTLRYAHLHPSRLVGATDRLCIPLCIERF